MVNQLLRILFKMPVYIDAHISSFDIHRAIIRQNPKQLQKLLRENECYSFYVGLLNTDFTLCETSLIRWGNDSYEMNFLAYIVAKYHGYDREAKNFYKKAVKQLEAYGNTYEEFISVLKKGEESAGLTDTFKSSYTDKALFYAVLGMKYPSKREYFFNKARQFNFRVTLQKSILDSVL